MIGAMDKGNRVVLKDDDNDEELASELNIYFLPGSTLQSLMKESVISEPQHEHLHP